MNLRLRDFQYESLYWLDRGRHVITVAPTGMGKSLIFERYVQKPNVRAILISPLIALARQQAEKLSRLGVNVALGTSPVKAPPPKNSGVWIVAPERLFQSGHGRMLNLLAQWCPNFLIVDECHCISEWGGHFRQAFTEIPTLVHRFNIRKSLWLTATLSPDARRQLHSQIGSNIIEVGKFELPKNIHIFVKKLAWNERVSFLLKWLEGHLQPGIIFVGSRKFSHRLERIVSALGRSVHIYHAGLASEERGAIESQIKQKKADIIIATSAFGMGMDYDYLSWCVIWQLPPSILSLTQEIGRVGRNLNKGEVCILWSEEDFRLIGWMVENSPRGKQALFDLYELFKKSTDIQEDLKRYFNKGFKSYSAEDK